MPCENRLRSIFSASSAVTVPSLSSTARRGSRPRDQAYEPPTEPDVVVGREGVVRLAPQAAAFYTAAGLKVHIRGLDFGAVAMARRDAASSDVVISGEIRNQAKHRLPVPRLVYDVKDQSAPGLVANGDGRAKCLDDEQQHVEPRQPPRHKAART